MHELALRGKFHVTHVRSGRVLCDLDVPNGITAAAKNRILDTMFNGSSQFTSWYIGLIDNSGFAQILGTDVMNSHSGWSEFQSYSNNGVTTSNRLPWGQGAASAQSVSNGSGQLMFKFTASGVIAGIFVTSSAAKGANSSSDILWSTALFSAQIPVSIGDLVAVSYSVSC